MSNPALKKVVDGAVGQQQPRPEYQSWQMPGQQQGGFAQPGQPGYGQPGQPGFGQQGFGPGGFAGGMQPGMPGFAPGQQGQAPYEQRSASSYMTMDDVVVKTSISIVTVIAAAIATWVLVPLDMMIGVAIGGALIGFVLGMVNAFKRNPNGALVIAYAVAEGVFLGGISGLFEMMYPGIVVQAMLGTMGVFVGMLVVYRTGAIRVTPKFQRWLAAALIGALVLMLFNLGYFLFTGEASLLRDGGPMAIGFSILMIGIAAFTLLADFDLAEQAIRRGAPKNFAWGIAFGLLASLVWLYIEILRLLSYFRE